MAEIDLSETEGDDTIKLITDFLQELESFLTASELEKGGSDSYAADKNRNGSILGVMSLIPASCPISRGSGA